MNPHHTPILNTVIFLTSALYLLFLFLFYLCLRKTVPKTTTVVYPKPSHKVIFPVRFYCFFFLFFPKKPFKNNKQKTVFRYPNYTW